MTNQTELKALKNRVWAAEVNADESLHAASEAWATCFKLVEMLEGRQPVDPTLIQSLKQHHAHVLRCRRGSCEHEYEALIRAGLISRLPTPPPGGPA